MSALTMVAACTHPRPPVDASQLGSVERWWIVIGSSPMLDAIDWWHSARDAQMVVLSGDPRIPVDELPRSTIRLAYVSVGEANPRRPYWPEVNGQPFVVEPNLEWPDNVRVDIRSNRWQDVLMCEEVSRLMQRGFDGLMLDTIDTAAYLESKDPARFAGSREALRDWLRRLRAAFPRAVIVANGSEALVDVAPFVDGFVVEGVFSVYDIRQRTYRRTTDAERDWKLGAIARARGVAPRPVFSIEYADVGDVALSEWATQESLRHGFRPYVGVRALNTPP
ncbi:MAG TPA: endo alpha-1,4 polygalactosaminidase [Polyangia bacterium]|nr:endo alpha-1,4 polygalactosaminidase [Polyangia bacterium]